MQDTLLDYAIYSLDVTVGPQGEGQRGRRCSMDSVCYKWPMFLFL
jgi:hypothetical protein